MSKKLKKVIPNTITTMRLLLALIFPLTYILKYRTLTFIIFLIAAISDFFDGFLARRWQVVSNYGKKVDPIADKLLSILALSLIATFNYNIMFITLCLEIIIALNGIKRYSNIKFFNVSAIGKLKTVFLFFTITIALLSIINPTINFLLLPFIIITTILQLFSLKGYIFVK